jgi:hypothetical protein
VKSFGVFPLACAALPTFTPAPVVVKVAIKAVTFVPNGTVTAMVFAFSSMVPVAAGLVSENAVMALALETGLPPPPPPPPQALKRTENKATITAETMSLFMMLASLI